ncbi:MAG TPA: sigma-54 dependent transcriptional regulator [Vicinamibacterales bacterium]|nr:sigma-54 dependent transcriptional regulator [Vicinamibacterales bacterium]
MVVSGKDATRRDVAGAECVLGRIAFERGQIDNALDHFQRSEAAAEQSRELSWLFWTRVGVMRIVSQRSGREAIPPILSQLRSITTAVADLQLTAALHVNFGLVEGMAGLFASAERHSLLALSLLKSEPNAWLEAVCLNTLLASAFGRGDVARGLRWQAEALSACRQSSVADIIRAVLGNIGNLLYLRGDFDSAAEHMHRAAETLRPDNDNGFGIIDTLARIRIAQDRLDDAEILLSSIAQSIRKPEDRTLYGYRHAILTRIELLARKYRLNDALPCADDAIALATHCGDQLLLTLATLARADILSALGDTRGAALGLATIATTIVSAPPSVRGEYHRVLACASLREGRPAEADQHARRAIQTFAATGNQLGVDTVTKSMARLRAECAARAADPDHAPSQSAATLHAVAELFAHATDARIQAAELSAVLTTADAVAHVAVTDLGNPQTWFATELSDQPAVSTLRLDDRIQLTVEGRADIASAASLNAATALLAGVQDARAARLTAEQQAAVWPAEHGADADLDAILVGHMEETAAMVKRVARTNVLVLLLGDSGTGKEIVARAVHVFSGRAAKPFIPVNCAALPGHLLESTLFGYKRGAFTGADRDNPGLIRAAAGGTLFLDEIGELGLELQPKLLRFLESSEIAPLGELTTIKVDVRIVCATNRNLASLVEQGLFREDLFYRINVVRLMLKPLRERRDEIPHLVTHFVAAAAKEFGKGYIRVAEETMERLLLYRWPGNIRQLQNEIRRMVALVEPSGTLEADMISDEILDALPLIRPTPRRRSEIAVSVSLEDKLPSAVARIETEMIKAALREHHGRVDLVAKALGISRKGLYLKRQRLGV